MKRELTNQELLDRYVHAVKMLLPLDKMDDIAAEIRSNLESLVDDRASELRRELSPGELSAILKQHGHPMVVAGRYRDPAARGLISSELFPFYWFTLRAIAALWVVIRIIVAVFTLQGTATAGSVLLYLGRDILLAAFFIPAGVTLIFAVWEYLEFKFRYSERWKPESLAPVPHIRLPRVRNGPGFTLLVESCGSCSGLCRCSYRSFTGSGGEGACSARPTPLTRCGCPCGCWPRSGFVSRG